MEYSYNGWPASKTLRIRPLVVAGESFAPGVLDNDDVFTVLQYVAEQLHARVEPIVRGDWHQADDWGFSFRPSVNDPFSLSCHASATAFDYNATRHPNGVPASANFTAAQIAEIRQILAEIDHVVAWGGDFNGTPDAMHFELNVRPDNPLLATVAARIREGNDPMADYEAQLNRIEKAVNDGNAASKRRDQAIREADRKLAKATRELLQALGDDVAQVDQRVIAARKKIVARALDEVDAAETAEP